MEVTTEVRATYQGVGKRGHGSSDLGKDLLGVVPGSLSVWVRYMGDDTSHWGVFGRIPQQCGPQDNGTEIAEGG